MAKYNSVSKMLDAIGGDDSLAESIKKRIAQRQVVKMLQAMRTARDISQAKIAEELECTQSRVSKIESGLDSQISIGELEAYARALGCDVHLMMMNRGSTAADRVKHFAFAIKRELDSMADCAHKDEDIAEAVASFFGEAFFNILRLIQKSCEKLPNGPDDEPYIRIGMSVDDLPCDVSQVERKNRIKSEPQSAKAIA